MGGIGFLGAGTILRNEDTIEGLTTAASVWIAGAFGTAAGGGHYRLVGLSTGLALVILLVFGVLVHHLHARDS